MKNKENIIKFPKGFFTRNIPNKTEPDPPEDMIPFEWSEEVLSGKMKGKVIATFPERKNIN